MDLLVLRAFAKHASITILTGGMGAGKSTRAAQLKGKYDLVVGSDVGSAQGGQYVIPPKAGRDQIRKARIKQMLATHRGGGSVLLEGVYRGIAKYPAVLPEVSKVIELRPSAITRVYRVGKRSRERNTPMLPDLKYVMGELRREPKDRKILFSKLPKVKKP